MEKLFIFTVILIHAISSVIICLLVLLVSFLLADVTSFKIIGQKQKTYCRIKYEAIV